VRYQFENCVLDTERRELRRGANAVSVAPQVFDLLDYLIRNRERVVSKEDLIAAIWDGRIVSDAALTTRLNVARNAIGDSGEEQRLIKTLPRKGFRFVGTVREDEGPTAAANSTGEPLRLALALPDKPSIAVLPFVNLSGDSEQEYFADGIVEDIITELSRFSELFVIARNSSFQYKGKATDVREIGRELGVRYVLEGSVRRSGDRIRIAAQLIDAAMGTHRWAERYDRKLEGIFAVQDEVVRTIVAILAAHVRKAETERTRSKPPTSWQAYDYYLQAVDAMASFDASFSVVDLYETRRLLHQSLSMDASYARSYAILANTYDAAWVNQLDSDFLNPSALDQAHQFARKAVQLDPNLPLAHASLGFVLMFKHEHDESIAAFERAIALNPNYVGWPFGAALVLAGESRRAIDVLEAYMRLDPFHAPVGLLGLAHYMLKQYSQALPVLRDCVTRAPNLRPIHVWLAATLAQLGQLEEARAEAAEVLRLQPNYSISGTPRRLMAFKNPKDDRHFFDGLRKAGLPE
jgi:adenylate cyclase